MNPTQPEAAVEDSKLPGTPGGRAGSRRPAALLALLGAAALVAAELSPVLRIVTLTAHPVVARTLGGAGHDGDALLPIAGIALVLAGLLARARGSGGARRAIGACLGALGLAALGVALLVDLPGVHAQGAVRGAGGLVPAEARAGVGLYLETLGAALLLLAGAGATLL